MATRADFHQRMAREASRRILRMVTETGPRKRSVLLGLAGGDETIINAMLRDGRLEMIGSKRGAVYGAPQKAKAPR